MLKQLKLRKMIELKKKEEEEVRAKEEELLKREAELEKSLEESENEEDLNLVNEEIEKLETEKKENDETKAKVEKEIEDLEKELNEVEEKEESQQDDGVVDGAEERNSSVYKFERGNKEMRKLNIKREEVRELVKREDVSTYLRNIKTSIQKRSVAGLDLTVPTEMMDIIMDNVGRTSVFYDLVDVRSLNGDGRANIVAEAAEAIWTEMVGSINELEYAVSQIEVDGYKVGGFTGVDNSIIEDSDENVFVLITTLLSDSIALAVDKAVVYGKGKANKMPTGYVTKLNGSSELKSKNIVSLTTANTKLEKIIAEFKNIDRGISSKGEVVVVMNEKTWLGTVLPLSIATNSAGAYVSAANGLFPATGYKVKFSDVIPEGEIHAGDYSKYLLVERKGKKVASSTEAKFTDDVTLFKATARYDGISKRDGAFVVIGLNGTTPAVTTTFAADKANTPVSTSDETTG